MWKGGGDRTQRRDEKGVATLSGIYNGKPLLETKSVSKRFGAVQALTTVDFDVYPGEVVALVGDNGAGKSTLIKGIAGIYGFDEGRVLFDGKEVHIHSPREAAQLGIEVVYQDLALADNLDVVANMFLGREWNQGIPTSNDAHTAPSGLRRLLRNLLPITEIDMEKRAVGTLNELAVTTLRSVRLPVASLSGGQRQSVAIAKAVLWNSRVVILDEPTAALGVAQTRQVLNLVRRLAEKQLAVVIISHNLHDIFEVADRITVLRLGHKVHTYMRSETDQQEVVHAITAGQLSTVPGMAS
ncbi:MAG: sugar ABC transporter ATP-binding protein [Anaerolineae bacterium]|nr:sugar ABC transporter ATP-binding protein [Anaerolineae bacterium]